MRQVRTMYDQGPARSTAREWVASFAYGAGYLLLDALLRHLLALKPGVGLPASPPEHLARVPDANQRRRLENAHTFWLLAERLYAQVKQRQPDLHFSAAQIFRFLLHWLQGQRVAPRLFWCSPSNLLSRLHQAIPGNLAAEPATAVACARTPTNVVSHLLKRLTGEYTGAILSTE